MSILSLSPDLSRYRTFGDVQVEVVFDSTLDPETVTGDSFYITEGLEESSPRVPGDLSVVGEEEDTIRFIPARGLAFGIPYQIHTTRGLRNEEGHPCNGIFPEVRYGNTEVPAPGDRFVVNIPDDFNEDEVGNNYSLMGYYPPLLGVFEPEDTDPALPELIPGIHATEAWKLSKGAPDVLVVVLDNGLGSYVPEDLENNLFLNRGELPVPRDASGNAATVTDIYDFNRDGRFNIRDYIDAGHAISPGGTLTPVADLNDNGKIDPEDLMLGYTDGTDGYPADADTPADTGGLVDDISGYDFFRKTHWALGMPEFPEGAHGGDRAREVAAEADNGRGVPGTCPNCSVMVCRVTYALIEEGELVAHAMRYAIAKGADVIVAALGSLSGTTTEVEAFEEANEAGVAVIVGMSDESSFHHSTPSVFNYGIAAKCNYAFFWESFCTGYGGQVHFAANGQCGSTACGMSGGAAGLLVSRARDLGYCLDSRPGDPSCTEPDLVGNEVKQLLSLTAEKPSTPDACLGILTNNDCKIDTWDMHQGYGRLNLFRALNRLETRPLPPAVQILEPGWFALLNPSLPSAGNLVVDIKARVPLDSITCEWAVGIEPDEEDFQALACAAGSGENLQTTLPLAEMANALGGATLTPDGPEGKAVTVRIRAHTGAIFGEDRRVFSVHRDPTWMEGFPVSLVDRDGDILEEVSPDMENAFSIEASPALEDLDGDGTDEAIICTSNGQLHVLTWSPDTRSPRELPGYPLRFVRSATVLDGIGAAPAVADIDRDGSPDIVVATLGGYLYAFRGIDAAPLGGPDGKILTADPPANDSPESFGAGNSFFGSPLLTDLNRDGFLDVVAGCSDQKVYAVDGASIARGAAQRLAGWPVHPRDPEACSQLGSSILSTIAAADLTGDGTDEIIVGTSEACHTPETASARLYALHPEGTLSPGGATVSGFPVSIPPNPLGLEIPLPPLTTGLPGSPVAARMGDEIVIGTGTFLGPHSLVHVNPGTGAVSVEKLSSFTFGCAGSGAFQRQDGNRLAYAIPSVTVGNGGFRGIVGLVSQVDLFLPETSSKPAASHPMEDYQFLSNPSFVDVDGDGTAELVAASGGHLVHAYTMDGGEAQGWPKFTYGWHMASPAFGDLDGDGMLEMVAPVREGRVFVWRTEASVCGTHPWKTFHHDNRRTGNLDAPVPAPSCP